MNREFEELVNKRLNGNPGEREKQLLATMLAIPENQMYLASKIDEQFFNEWMGDQVNNEIGRRVFQRIQKRIKEDGDRQVERTTLEQDAPVIEIAWYRKKVVNWVATAAASIIVAISFWVLFNNNRSKEQPLAVQTNSKPAESTRPLFRREVNTSGKQKHIQLADGSMVVLGSKSEVSYPETFTVKREITLIGKAYFKVAKDKTKPFTVISGDISTTALGTEFTITAFKNEGRIIVRLYEGKVVVKPVEKVNRKLRNNIYLLPGQEFIYAKTNITARVQTFKLNNNDVPELVIYEESASDNPSIPQNSQGSWYMFNNQSLEQVFHQLSAIYQVQIFYNKKDVANIYFTSKYNTSDSLELILAQIATLNNLTISKKDNAFIVSR